MNVFQLGQYAKNQVQLCWQRYGIEATEDRINKIYNDNPKLRDYMLTVHKQLLKAK